MAGGPLGDEVVVVTGLPRAGTSLLMQMLEAGGVPAFTDRVRRPDRHNPRGYYEHEAVKALRRDAAFLGAARGRAVKVVHALVRSLPEGLRYRVILVERSLPEVLASQRRMLADTGAGPPEDLPDERLAEIYQAQLRELCAWLEATPRVAWLAVAHAEVLAAPARAARAIDAFLGGGLDVAAMAAAVDPALHRERWDPDGGASLSRPPPRRSRPRSW